MSQQSRGLLDFFGTGQPSSGGRAGEGFDVRGLLSDPLLQFGVETLSNRGDVSAGLRAANSSIQNNQRSQHLNQQQEREQQRFDWERQQQEQAQAQRAQWQGLLSGTGVPQNPEQGLLGAPQSPQDPVGAPAAPQVSGNPLLDNLSPQEKQLLSTMSPQQGQAYLLNKLNQPRFETVQNPYGRGGVGQRNSQTGQIGGYQGPVTPSAPPAAVQEFNFAKQNGYEGSFADFMQTVKRNPGTTVNVNNGGLDTPDGVPQFPGKSVGAGARNIILNVDEKRRQGQEITPAQEDAYNLALKEVQSSTTDATFAANINQAQTDIAKGVEILFPEGLEGEFSRSSSALGNMPLTDARTARQSFRRAVEVLLRSRTGAAAPDSEVNNYMDAFYPSPLDTEEGARIKVQRLQQYFSDTAALRPRAFGESISQTNDSSNSNVLRYDAQGNRL